MIIKGCGYFGGRVGFEVNNLYIFGIKSIGLILIEY